MPLSCPAVSDGGSKLGGNESHATSTLESDSGSHDEAVSPFPSRPRWAAVFLASSHLCMCTCYGKGEDIAGTDRRYTSNDGDVSLASIDVAEEERCFLFEHE